MKKNLQDKAVIDGTKKTSNGGNNTKDQTAATIVANLSGLDAGAMENNKKTIALLPAPQPLNSPLPLGDVERGNDLKNPKPRKVKLSGLGKDMRHIIQAKQEEENNAIAERFKNALLDPASTQAEIRASVTPTYYSTLKGDIKFTDDGTIKGNTLDKLLKQAFSDAEEQMRANLKTEFDARFNAQPTHTPDELRALDAMCKKIKQPFKNHFPPQNAQAA